MWCVPDFTATTIVEASLEIADKSSHPGTPRLPINTPVNPQKLGQHAPSMDDGSGDTRNGVTRPMGPKRNPLKQTTQANARVYYNSETPRVGNRKSKNPSQSPSVEPTDHIQPTAKQSITYAAIT